MLQMIVNPTPAPQPITFNYEELKAELTEALSRYENRVYTEEEIPVAKKEKATLNNLKTVLNDERIRREKEYNAPFMTFKAQVKELCDLIDNASQRIGNQLDAFEEKRIHEKQVEIELEYATCVLTVLGYANIPDWLALERIFDNKWLNKTFTMAKVKEAIIERLQTIARDIETLKGMGDYEAIECYKTNLDLNLAIKESRDMKEMRANARETEKREAKPKTNVTPVWVSFRALLNSEQATALAHFCKDNKIKLEQII